jgi:hypothetical protein
VRDIRVLERGRIRVLRAANPISVSFSALVPVAAKEAVLKGTSGMEGSSVG